MTGRPPDVEIALATALRQRSAEYARAHAALVVIQQRLQAGEAPLHSACPELQRLLDAFRIADEQLAPLQDQWKSLSLRPGADLAAQIDRHQAQLEQTIALVNELTAAAETSSKQLPPRLDQAARGRRMQAAYAASGGH